MALTYKEGTKLSPEILSKIKGDSELTRLDNLLREAYNAYNTRLIQLYKENNIEFVDFTNASLSSDSENTSRPMNQATDSQSENLSD